MMPPLRRFFALGLWVCVTATATAIVWAGTSTVAADLTDRPAPLVAHHDVVSALESGGTASQTAPGITTPEANAPAPTGSSDTPGAPNGSPQATPSQPPAAVSPSPGVASPPEPAAPPVTDVPSPPTTQGPQRPTATYATAGGVATVACVDGFFIELVSATPANGYSAKVVSSGPIYVEVHFVRSGRDEPLWAFCVGQPIRAYGGSQIPGRPAR